MLTVIILNVLGLELWSSSVELLMVPGIAIFYFIGDKKVLGLTLFFIFHSLGNIVNVLDFNQISDWSYYLCNSLYILAYIAFICYVSKDLKFLYLFKNNKLDLSVLVILAFSMVYVLIEILLPIEFDSNYIYLIQLIEFTFSLVLVVLMSLSFFKYIQFSSKKFFFLFLGCLCLVFAELILIGYYYIAEYVLISYTSTVLYVSAFFMLYYHTLINHVSFIETE